MSTERTIRPENLDSTVRSTDIGGTVRPASLDGTIRVTNTAAPSLGLDGTVRADNMYIQQEDINDNSFLLKGVKYRNLQCLSDNSGEAQVFLVEKDGEEYVLKIYYPNFNVNKNILRAVLNFDFEMIVRVFDYGKTYVDGKHRYYELMEYLRGGTLSEYKLGGDVDKFRRIALQGAAAWLIVMNATFCIKTSSPATSSSGIKSIQSWFWATLVSPAC